MALLWFSLHIVPVKGVLFKRLVKYFSRVFFLFWPTLYNTFTTLLKLYCPRVWGVEPRNSLMCSSWMDTNQWLISDNVYLREIEHRDWTRFVTFSGLLIECRLAVVERHVLTFRLNWSPIQWRQTVFMICGHSAMRYFGTECLGRNENFNFLA